MRDGPSYLGLMVLLTLIFVALKVTGQVDWSWIWVLMPLWVMPAIAAATLAAVAAVGVVFCLFVLLLVAVVFVVGCIQAAFK